MSNVSKLNDFYGNFFKGAGYFSVSPYIETQSISADWGGNLFLGLRQYIDNVDEEKKWDAKAKKIGIAACVVLTVIPVLPVITAVTFTLALIGSILAALSALITYPIAAALDCCTIPDEPHSPGI